MRPITSSLKYWLIFLQYLYRFYELCHDVFTASHNLAILFLGNSTKSTLLNNLGIVSMLWKDMKSNSSTINLSSSSNFVKMSLSVSFCWEFIVRLNKSTLYSWACHHLLFIVSERYASNAEITPENARRFIKWNSGKFIGRVISSSMNCVKLLRKYVFLLEFLLGHENHQSTQHWLILLCLTQ